MKRKRLISIGIPVILFVAVMSAATISMALTDKEGMRRPHIVNLEAQPLWFRPGQSVDFVVSIKYDGGTQDGFDVDGFHERRLVGWATNQRFNNSMNTFRLRAANFRGDPGGFQFDSHRA